MATGTFTPVINPAGYQGCGLSGKLGTTATGLAVQTAGYQEAGLSGKTGGTQTGLGVAGYQELGLSGKSGGDATGLATTTTYYVKIALNGAATAETSITTASTVTFTAVIALLNAAMTGAFAGIVWSLTGGDVRCTSSTKGTASAIALTAGTTGTDLLVTFTGFTVCDAAVPGVGGTYYFKITPDGGSQVEKSIIVTTSATFTSVIALMNAQMTGTTAGFVWGISGGDLRCTSPTLGSTSAVALAAGSSGTDLFVTLTGFSSLDTAVAGTTSRYYFKISMNGGAATEAYIDVLNDATFAAVIVLMNAKMTPAAILGCVWGLQDGDLVCTSSLTNGPYSRIGLTAGSSGTDLFVTLTGFADFGSSIPGSTVEPNVSEKYITYFGAFAVSAPADTYATGGCVASFSGVVPQSGPPSWVDVLSNGPSSGALSGVYLFVPGTTIANGKLMVLTAKGNASGLQALQENGNGVAFDDATVKTNLDRIAFKATWRKGK